ncbi:hypothetical protein KSB_36510 [Ktedonobacter robiniae]|uniref:Uncharacterized protein n=1 Tax=Ktedonobacter robiniae TaxID=2778365 RepID=A0ABQ3UQX2_9CHLR|nr:hypothetical protein KSB_36510 [Ktedonobacter robiniae]
MLRRGIAWIDCGKTIAGCAIGGSQRSEKFTQTNVIEANTICETIVVHEGLDSNKLGA